MEQEMGLEPRPFDLEEKGAYRARLPPEPVSGPRMPDESDVMPLAGDDDLGDDVAADRGGEGIAAGFGWGAAPLTHVTAASCV